LYGRSWTKIQEMFLLFFCVLQPDSFLCPQCQAPKKRFAGYDPETGRALGGGGAPISVLLGVLAGAVAVGALVLYGFQ
jgi:hypothetical protein